MWPNPQFHADLITFIKEFLDGKVQFCAVIVTGLSVSVNTQVDSVLNNQFHATGFVLITSFVNHKKVAAKALNERLHYSKHNQNVLIHFSAPKDGIFIYSRGKKSWPKNSGISKYFRKLLIKAVPQIVHPQFWKSSVLNSTCWMYCTMHLNMSRIQTQVAF